MCTFKNFAVSVTKFFLVTYFLFFFSRFFSQAHSQSHRNVGFGLNREVFFLNLEDGYFGCQVNESTDYLQLYELSKLCDGQSDCYLGSDELSDKLKCSRKLHFLLFLPTAQFKITIRNSLVFLTYRTKTSIRLKGESHWVMCLYTM